MSLWQIFRWPLALALLTLVGLVSGLVSDGWGDALAALGLMSPATVALWFGVARRAQRSRANAGPEATSEPSPS